MSTVLRLRRPFAGEADDIGRGKGGRVLLGPRTVNSSGNVLESRRSRCISAIGISADIEDDLDIAQLFCGRILAA